MSASCLCPHEILPKGAQPHACLPSLRPHTQQSSDCHTALAETRENRLSTSLNCGNVSRESGANSSCFSLFASQALAPSVVFNYQNDNNSKPFAPAILKGLQDTEGQVAWLLASGRTLEFWQYRRWWDTTQKAGFPSSSPAASES